MEEYYDNSLHFPNPPVRSNNAKYWLIGGMVIVGFAAIYFFVEMNEYQKKYSSLFNQNDPQ